MAYFDKYVTTEDSFPGFDRVWTVSVETTTATWAALAFFAISVGAMAIPHVVPIPAVFTAPIVVLSLSFVPGTLFLLTLKRKHVTVGAEHLLYAFGSSLIVLMFVGTVSNVLLPYVGVTRPLMPVPLAASVTAAVGLLAVAAHWRGPDEPITLQIPPLWSTVPLALLTIPLLSVLGVNLLNATGSNVLVIGVLLAVAAIPILVVRGLHEHWHPLAIWSIALAILYHKSLWRYAGFGGRPHGITAWETGRWSPGIRSIEPYSSELLQNGVLFPLYARLSDLFIITQYEVVNPFFISFVPLAMYITFRRYVSVETAFLGAALFVFCHPFYLQYPTAGRAATPVLFLVLFGVALSNEGLPSGSRAALAALFLLGVVVSHYGTSYYVIMAFLFAIVLMYALRTFDRFVGTRLGRTVAEPDGGTADLSLVERLRRKDIFSVWTVFFFISATMGWYLYARSGWKFEILPKFFRENLLNLFVGEIETGRTTARVTKSFISGSLAIARNIYILLAVLTLLGLAVMFYRRTVGGTKSLDDSYLAIAAALFGIFGMTTILQNWGGGRPMMITFSFTTVFAVVGAIWVVESTGRVSAILKRYLPWSTDESGEAPGRVPQWESLGKAAFAAMLAIFLLLNTGVAAVTVFGDERAPSTVPLQSTLEDSQGAESQVTVHRDTDILTHIWTIQHFDEDYQVHGDTFGARQFDWYRPDIAARTPAIGGGYTQETKPEVFEFDRQRAGTQPGYILAMGHNVELDAFWPSRFEPGVPASDISIERRNRVYTNGESHVYFYADASPSAEANTDDSGDS